MPDRSKVKTALNAIKRYADYEAFFHELRRADWIEPLAEEGMFSSPPGPVKEGDLIRFPIWPESRYLAKVAADGPEAALRVLESIPQTENVRVHEDLVDVLIAVPPKLAAPVTTLVAQWLETPYQLLLPNKVATLVVRLAETGEGEAALRLAKALLAVEPDPEVPPGLQGLAPNREPRVRFDEWQYDQVLKETMPRVVEAVGTPALDLLSDLLARAIEVTRPAHEPGEDYSYVWRSAIEESAQNSDSGIRGPLVRAVRDAAEQIVVGGQSDLAGVVRALEFRKWRVFTRIALHLVWQFRLKVPDLVGQYLLNPDMMEDLTLFHEFWMLARDGLSLLKPLDREHFLVHLEENLQAQEGEVDAGLTPKERAEQVRYAQHWFYRRLGMVESSLDGPRLAKLEALQKEFGPQEHPEFLAYSSGVVTGPTSPISEQELQQMPLEEIVQYLKTWKPTGKWPDPSPNGLGRAIWTAASATPDRFAAAADSFKGLEPSYVGGFLYGLLEARRAKRPFVWEPVLRLSKWVMDQPRETSRLDTEDGLSDPGWGSTRKAMADLLAAGFEASEGGIPPALRSEAWTLIESLARDPDPTPEHELQYGGSNMDPFTLSINTVRGQTIHAAIQYALWVRRGLDSSSPGGQKDFDSMPEVRNLLEAHLNPTEDPSVAVRSVYGRWFPWLLLLDRQWAIRHRIAMFPQEVASRHLRDAAWHAYLLYSGVFDNVFDDLSEEYKLAVARIGQEHAPSTMGESPEEHLAEHLMVFYWRGKVDFTDRGGLLEQFYAKAPSTLREHALNFVGRSLRGDDKTPVPDSVRERLETLFQWRLDQATRSAPEERQDELSAFTWWFSSAKFELNWSLESLLAVLALGVKLDASFLVVEELARIAGTKPRQAVEALDRIVRNEDERIELALASPNPETVIATAIKSSDGGAKTIATRLIHFLGAKGVPAYEHLLAVEPSGEG